MDFTKTVSILLLHCGRYAELDCIPGALGAGPNRFEMSATGPQSYHAERHIMDHLNLLQKSLRVAG